MILVSHGIEMISQERLKELFTYAPETGVFVRNINVGNRKVGEVAGTVDKKTGYRVIQIDGKFYKAHRLAFLYMGKDIPNFVDHINGQQDDNRWENIRPATIVQNNQNAKSRKDNSSGVKGVSWCKRERKWIGYVYANGRAVLRKYYKDLISAELEVKRVRSEHHGEFVNNG